MNVLIMDADPLGRVTLKRFLIRDFECTVSEAENGLEGLEALERQQFDLVVIDLNLPIVSGQRVLEIIRQSADGATQPVLVTTETPDPAKIRRIIDLGVSDCVVKPYDPGALKQRFSRIVRATVDFRTASSGNGGAVNALNLLPQGLSNSLPTVLIVDNDKDFRHFVVTTLAGKAVVRQSGSGVEALKTCMSSPPTFVLVGQNLGILRSDVFVDELRRSPALNRTRIIAVAPKNMIEKVKASAPYDAAIVRTFLANLFLDQLTHLFPASGALAGLQAANPSLRTNIISAVELVSGVMLGVELGPIEDAAPSTSGPEVMATVEISVENIGPKLAMDLACSATFGRTLASRILQMPEESATNEDARETMAEIGNIVTGRIKSSLAERAISVTCGLPKAEVHQGVAPAPPVDALTCYFADAEQGATFRVTLRNQAA
ncbi:MAG: response regulator [Vicinamibacterales bacterium]